MYHQIRRAGEIVRSRGIRALFHSMVAAIFRAVRPFSPHLQNTYNGVLVSDYRWTDVFDPTTELGDRPTFEETIVTETKRNVSAGDTVVILGGGIGVVTVHAARATGKRGKVIVYEAAAEMIEKHERTMALNETPAAVSSHHAIVGPGKQVWGDTDGAAHVKPESIERSDVCIIDIEGAERSVVPALPKIERLIVETHGTYNSPTSKVVSELENRGYEVDVAGLAEPAMAERHRRDDVRVVVGTQSKRDTVTDVSETND